MIDTKVTIGQIIAFENDLCFHYCKIIEIFDKSFTLEFENGCSATLDNNKYLRELRIVEELDLEKRPFGFKEPVKNN